jgi:glycosyltransferase involved in cell wall biosynthesis
MIRVSVIMPAYNAAHMIGSALESALGQTETSLEVLVINDASTDATASVVIQFAARDARVRLITNASNRGPGAARNLGIEQARGAWIALLDADDVYVPTRLERLLELAEQHEADMVSDNLLMCPESGDASPTLLLSATVLPAPKLMTPTEFILGNVGSRHSPRLSHGFMQPMARREFLERNAIRYDERNRFGEDYMLNIRCLLAGASWWVTPEPLYRYTVRNGSLTEIQTSGDLQRIRQFEESMLRDNDRVATDPELARALNRHKAMIDRCYYYRAFTDAVKALDFIAATRLLFESHSGFNHIMAEILSQAPVIAAKAARGGYFQRGAARSTQRAA